MPVKEKKRNNCNKECVDRNMMDKRVGMLRKEEENGRRPTLKESIRKLDFVTVKMRIRNE